MQAAKDQSKVIAKVKKKCKKSQKSKVKSGKSNCQNKKKWRFTIGQQRSKSLSLLYIEKELLDNSINYGKLIDELAEFKVN